jgi:hypothetical protein
MEKLDFSANWNNKLDCKCFSTIRIYNQAKHFKGNQFDVFLNKKYKNKVIVLGTIITKLNELSDYICYLDTGYSREETIAILQKMFPRIDFKTQKICILLLKKVDPPKAIQNKLFP